MAEESDIRYARALGVVLGNLDSIVSTSQSGIDHFNEVELLRRRLIEINAIATHAIGRANALVPETSGIIDVNLVELECGHYTQRTTHGSGTPISHYRCNVCGKSVRIATHD